MKKSKYIVNQDYFKTVNEKSAYIIGFIMGDGNIGKNNSNNYYLQIRIHKQDVEILEFIRDELSPNRPLIFNQTKQKSGKISECVCLKITSNQLCQDLIKYGVVERKSGKEQISCIPQKYLPDFLRGYFDADGSLAIKKNKKYILSYVCANKDFLVKIQEYFGVGKIENGHGRCYTYYVSKLDEILKIGNIIYNGNFYLKRKKDRFDNMPKRNKYIAFGEIKTLTEWSRDKRCVVHKDTLLYRINNTSLSMEESITTPPKQKNGNMYLRQKTKTRKHCKNNYNPIGE